MHVPVQGILCLLVLPAVLLDSTLRIGLRYLFLRRLLLRTILDLIDSLIYFETITFLSSDHAHELGRAVQHNSLPGGFLGGSLETRVVPGQEG